MQCPAVPVLLLLVVQARAKDKLAERALRIRDAPRTDLESTTSGKRKVGADTKVLTNVTKADEIEIGRMYTKARADVNQMDDMKRQNEKTIADFVQEMRKAKAEHMIADQEMTEAEAEKWIAQQAIGKTNAFRILADKVADVKQSRAEQAAKNEQRRAENVTKKANSRLYEMACVLVGGIIILNVFGLISVARAWRKRAPPKLDKSLVDPLLLDTTAESSFFEPKLRQQDSDAVARKPKPDIVVETPRIGQIAMPEPPLTTPKKAGSVSPKLDNKGKWKKLVIRSALLEITPTP